MLEGKPCQQKVPAQSKQRLELEGLSSFLPPQGVVSYFCQDALVGRYQQHYPKPTPDLQEYIEDIDLEFLIDDLPKILTSMQMGADRIHEIVISLRNFSRLDEAEMKPVNIHEGIDNTLLILQSRLKASGNNPGITIIKDYGNLPLVECYAGQLNQVFMNIVSNAIDALETQRLRQAENNLCQGESESDSSCPPSLSPTIWIHTELLDSHQVVIRIRDNGLGIPENVIGSLFDPFFTTKPVGKGTGLGLSISYQIVVEKHGGSLKCLSEPGQGAEFWIEIPIAPKLPDAL
jgi:signal transduction histidine kinase